MLKWNRKLIEFRVETHTENADAIIHLINQAYRGNNGQNRWTSEAHLVTGDRIHLQQLETLILDTTISFYTVYSKQKLLGCIGLTPINDDTVELGSFAVTPDYHGSGLGARILQYAEAKAKPYFNQLQVSVISKNKPLIQFYQRRDYQATGQILPYPIHSSVGTPIENNLKLIVLQKQCLNKSK